MLLLFTDLDGTLLDHHTYSFDAALPALEKARALSIPVIFCTSKTRAETEAWRTRLRNTHPFIVENGGALYVPDGTFRGDVTMPVRRCAYGVIEFGSPYAELVEVLRAASAESRCPVRGFSDMSVEEVADRCGIPKERAELAKQREYDEPFVILGAAAESLLAAIERHGKRWTRGGRFHHIVGANDKSHCVHLLIYYYRQMAGAVRTAGLGDGLNDAAFLRAVDIPVVIESPGSARLLSLVPGARKTDHPGPQGWNHAVMEILEEHSRPDPGGAGITAGLR
jgi:mannosyl-3-phosphoglycerate phosphatase